MKTRTIQVAREFSPHPAGRERKHGPFTGEAFREDFLKPALSEYESVVVDLTGTAGIRSSFFDEAFGGLVRSGTPYEATKRIAIVSRDPSHESDIRKSIEQAWKDQKKSSTR